MLVISGNQLELLAAGRRREMVKRFARTLAQGFPDQFDETGAEEWNRHVATALTQAREEFGLIREDDLWAFLTLCVEFGWTFTATDGNAWMRDILCDQRLHSPSARLRHLREACGRRMAIKRDNYRRRRDFLL